MNWEPALEIIIARTGHERYRVLCSESWPDHEAYRNLMTRMTSDRSELEYPSIFQQTVNVASAVGSVVIAAAQGEPISVSPEEQDDRLAICHACEFWDEKQERCSRCGCFGNWKTWLATQRCPIGKW